MYTHVALRMDACLHSINAACIVWNIEGGMNLKTKLNLSITNCLILKMKIQVTASYLKSDNKRPALTFPPAMFGCLNPNSGKCRSKPKTSLVTSFNSLPRLSGSKFVNFLFTARTSFSLSIAKLPYRYGLLGIVGAASWKPRRRWVASALQKGKIGDRVNGKYTTSNYRAANNYFYL